MKPIWSQNISGLQFHSNAHPVRTALCSLSPSTNRRLISHSWTSPGAEATCTYWTQSCTQVPAAALFTPRNCFQKVNKREKPKGFLISENQSNTHAGVDGALCLRSAHQMERTFQHAAGRQLDCLQIWENLLCDQAIQVTVLHKNQTWAWSNTHTYLISFGLTFTAY